MSELINNLYPLPGSWMPDVAPRGLRRVIVHWTGGSNRCSVLDRSHYHFILDGHCKWHKGIWSVKSNAYPFRAATGYAAHTRNCNAGSIGVALCGMAGATESPFRAGKHPITEAMWQEAAVGVAQLCLRYDLYDISSSFGPYVSHKVVLQHGEVEKNLGIKQRGKWDINKLPWNPSMGPHDVQRDFRLRVADQLAIVLRHRGVWPK